MLCMLGAAAESIKRRKISTLGGPMHTGNNGEFI